MSTPFTPKPPTPPLTRPGTTPTERAPFSPLSSRPDSPFSRPAGTGQGSTGAGAANPSGAGLGSAAPGMTGGFPTRTATPAPASTPPAGRGLFTAPAGAAPAAPAAARPAVSSMTAPSAAGTGISTSPSVAASLAGVKATDEEFRQLRDFIYAQCGIYVADNRKYLLENRLANRLKLLNLKQNKLSLHA